MSRAGGITTSVARASAFMLVLLSDNAAAQAVQAQWQPLTFAVFAAIIALTLYVTYRAAGRVKTSADFYTAGGGISGLQNGWAIAGDYLSAASFLGIAGLIALYGYDGFMYSVGWLVAYITVLLVIAEPCRNIGRYTMGDILAFRNNPRVVKACMALSTIIPNKCRYHLISIHMLDRACPIGNPTVQLVSRMSRCGHPSLDRVRGLNKLKLTEPHRLLPNPDLDSLP
jgi:hypothetical protein